MVSCVMNCKHERAVEWALEWAGSGMDNRMGSRGGH